MLRSGYRTVHTVFAEVSITRHKQFTCPSCKKYKKRQHRFSQTINPFNKIDGVPKTRTQIYAELKIEADAWELQPMLCATCEHQREAEKSDAYRGADAD